MSGPRTNPCRTPRNITLRWIRPFCPTQATYLSTGYDSTNLCRYVGTRWYISAVYIHTQGTQLNAQNAQEHSPVCNRFIRQGFDSQNCADCGVAFPKAKLSLR